MPGVGRAADAADHPLPDVAREVQQQVAHAVRLLVGPPPECFVRKRLDGQTDLGAVFHEQLFPRAIQKKTSELCVHAIRICRNGSATRDSLLAACYLRLATLARTLPTHASKSGRRR